MPHFCLRGKTVQHRPHNRLSDFRIAYQAFLDAALILLTMRVPFASRNPYRNSVTQSGFGTFGGPHVLDLVARVASTALKACWAQKWLVHRRLRPEEFAARVHNVKTGAATYPIHEALAHIAGARGRRPAPQLVSVASKSARFIGTCRSSAREFPDCSAPRARR